MRTVLWFLQTAVRLVALGLIVAVTHSEAQQQEIQSSKTLEAKHGSSHSTWRMLSDDLEVYFPSQSGTLISSNSVLLRSSLSRFRIGVIRAAEYGRERARVQELCRKSGAAVCINANFYDEFGKPLGLVIDRGISHSPLHRGGTLLSGIFEASRSRIRIVSRLGYDNSQALEAIQAGPRLLLNGVALRGIRDNSRSSRSAICIDRNNRLVLFVHQSTLGGITLSETQDTLLGKNIDCNDALNLDGGGSAQLYVSPHVITNSGSLSENNAKNLSLQGFDEVPVALGLFERIDTAAQ